MISNNLSLKYGHRSWLFTQRVFILFCFLVSFFQITAQTPHCHADEFLADHLHSHDIFHEIEDYKNSLSDLSPNRNAGVIKELPVVFHIIHQGENIGQGANLSDAKILEQLEILNTDFALKNADRNNIPNQFTSAAADTEIQFCLARVDESGQATSGILRHQTSNITSVNFIENSIKPQTQWNPRQYINIWIVRMHNPSILGYSFLPIPSILGSTGDGIVVSHLKVGNQGVSTKGRTMVHEMGHYLGLLHMWGFEESDCNEDDQISDTPLALAPYYGCPFFPQFTCGTSDMFMNYMDYVDDNCMFMFTNGQKNIMQGVLNNQRISLLTNTDAICNGTVTSVDEVAANAIELSPNPCLDHINVNLNTEYQLVNYQIYDISGRLLIQQNEFDHAPIKNIQIPTQLLQSGAYVVRFETQTGISFSRRFIKSKD